jgi:hypothetical protein
MQAARMDRGKPVDWRLALIECLEEFRCPGDGVRTLDSDAGENAVQCAWVAAAWFRNRL